MTKFKSFLPPGLSIFDGKKFVVPQWVEVPMETTIEDVIANWEREVPKNVPGRFASTEDIEKFIAGKYIAKDAVISDDVEYKIPSSKPGKTYTVTCKHNIWSCGCVGFSYRRKCTHVEQAKNLNKK